MIVVILFLLLFAYDIAQAETRYVDPTAGACAGNYSIINRNCLGAGSTSYATIASGITWLQANPTSNILYLRGGTYTGSSAMLDSQNGSGFPAGTSWSDAPMIAGYPGETVVLKPGNNLGSFGGAIINMPTSGTTLHYLIFKNIVLDGTGMNIGTATDPGAQGVSFGSEGNTVHHIRFEDVEIRYMPSNGVAGRGDYHEWIRITVHHNGFGTQTAGYGPGANGMYNATGSNSVVRDSTFYHNLCYGVRYFDSGTRGAFSNIIYNSVFYSNGRSKAFNGTTASTCQSAGGGIVLGDDNNVAHHNIFYDNWRSVDVTAYNGRGTSTGNLIYNNTAYGSVVGYIIELSGVISTVFKNNIGIGNTANWAITGTNTSMSYNACASGNSCGTIGKLTIALITDCTLSTTDFHLRANSPCIDAGTNVGYSFYGSNPDLGGYESGEAVDTTPPAAPTGLAVQ